MRVLLIGSFDLYLHPYSKKYIDFFKGKKIDIKFIFWNRSLKKIEANDIYVPFNYQMNSYQSLIKKINGYLKYRTFVKEYLKKNYFDKLVIFTTQTMFLFSWYVLKKYKDKYIFDYRDETYEKYSFYRKRVEKCILYSKYTVISSPGFISNFKMQYDNKFVMCHNSKSNLQISPQKNDSDIIRISFWGMIRQPKYYKKIFLFFKNDNRFIINLYGNGYEKEMLKIIDELDCHNVYMHGEYDQHQIIDFVRNTDILLNCYSNNSIQKNAITVKMYEGIKYKIPMLIQKGSFMDAYLTNNNYPHISIDFDNDNIELTTDDVIEQFKSINIKSNHALDERIQLDEFVFYNKLKDFLK